MVNTSAALTVTLVGVIVAFAVAILFFRWLSPGSDTSDRYRRARLWAAWTTALVTASLLPPVIGRVVVGRGFDVDRFAVWVLGVVFWGGVAFFSGLAWSAAKRRAETGTGSAATRPELPRAEPEPAAHHATVPYKPTAQARSTTPQGVDDDRYWAAALQEFESPSRDLGAWARAFSECGGNEAAAKAAYLKVRKAKLQAASLTAHSEPNAPIRALESGAVESKPAGVQSLTTKEMAQALIALGFSLKDDAHGRRTVISPDGKASYYSHNDEEYRALLARLLQRANR